jgi:penicillin amidase
LRQNRASPKAEEFVRALRYLGVATLLLVIALFGLLLWYRQASLPLHEGRLEARGLEQTVRIERDASGIPNIVAASERDASLALGFAHAQDRLWQMEVNRRIASGRLAEILGPGALDADKFLRTIGVRATAVSIFENLDAEHRELLEAYAAGVNAYLARRGGPLPPEFLLTRAPAPEPWEPADSIGWSLMMAWDLARYSYLMELRRLQLAQRFSVAEINDFYPPYPGDAPAATADYAEIYRLLGLRRSAQFESGPRDIASLELGFGEPEGVGSNNWVVAGGRSVSGKPLLANDPHLGLTTPSLWYFAALTAPGVRVIGATLPGLPGIVIGRNDRVAWSFTNTGVDQQDFYLERLHPEDPGQYQTPDGWARFATHVERIRVRGGDDVELTVRRSRHGPVLSGLASIDKVFRHERYVLALRWSALEPDDRTVVAIRALNRAANFDEAERALAQFQVVTQSALVADVDGRIGMVVTGRIPVRGKDHDLRGIAPAPGWDARYDWSGYLPPEQAPRVRDPASGFVVTANHKVVAADYPHHLTHDWFLPYRARRVEHLLDSRAKHDVATFRSIQADDTSLAARDLMALLRNTQPLTEHGRDALARLKAWDGRMKADTPEPLLFHAWMRELKHRIYADDFGPLAADFVDGSERTAALLHLLAGRANSRDWCDDRTTSQRIESCATLASEALDDSVLGLLQATRRDAAGLRWGEAHQAVGEHRPMSNVPGLQQLFELRTAYPGDTFTINVGALSHRAESPFSTRHAASLRAIYDFAALDRNSIWVHSTGQVGNPFSDLYSSMLPMWRDVRYLPMRRAAAGEVTVLELRPG